MTCSQRGCAVGERSRICVAQRLAAASASPSSTTSLTKPSSLPSAADRRAPAGEDHAERRLFPDQPRQTMRPLPGISPTRTSGDANTSILGGDDDVAGERIWRPPPIAMPLTAAISRLSGSESGSASRRKPVARKAASGLYLGVVAARSATRQRAGDDGDPSIEIRHQFVQYLHRTSDAPRCAASLHHLRPVHRDDAEHDLHQRPCRNGHRACVDLRSEAEGDIECADGAATPARVSRRRLRFRLTLNLLHADRFLVAEAGCSRRGFGGGKVGGAFSSVRLRLQLGPVGASSNSTAASIVRTAPA